AQLRTRESRAAYSTVVPAKAVVVVGWAKRSVPTFASTPVTVGTARARLCPPYGRRSIRARSIRGTRPPLPLHRRESRPAHRLALHEIDEHHIGTVEIIMAGRRAGRFRLAAQLFVHAQPFAEDRAPRLRLVLNRLDLEAGSAQELGMAL